MHGSGLKDSYSNAFYLCIDVSIGKDRLRKGPSLCSIRVVR